MPTELKLWKVDGNQPTPVPRQKLDLEARLEGWLRNDIALLSSELLVIGQQVETAYGGLIDLLAIDSGGNLAILELKRDQTPRDIVAQTLDYASWVQDLGHESVMEIAAAFLKDATLDAAFQEAFHVALPDVLNERHRIYIVASSLDASTERIVKYLSETHDVDINVATFAYFKMDETELLGRSLLLDEIEVQTRAERKSKRQPARTWEELRALAEGSGVATLYDRAVSELSNLFDGKNRTRTNVAFIGVMGQDKARNVLLSIYPEESRSDRGLAVMLFLARLREYFGVTDDQVQPLLTNPAQDTGTWDPNATWFIEAPQLERLITLLKDAKSAEST